MCVVFLSWFHAFEGKIQPTNCLWISGFNSKTQTKDIETYISEAILNYKRTGRNRSQTTERIKIDWVSDTVPFRIDCICPVIGGGGLMLVIVLVNFY